MLKTIPVVHLPGVGQAKQKCLADLTIETVFDLLHYYPFRYEDRRIRDFGEFIDGERVTARAVVEGVAQIRWQGKKSVCMARLRIDGRHLVTGIWFNQPYLKQKLVDGRILTISGKYNEARSQIVAASTDFGSTSGGAQSEFLPVYRVTKGLSSPQLASLMQVALERYGHELEDILPYDLTQKYRLVAHRVAVASTHQPKNNEELRQAHRRLAFEEFFLFQLELQYFRRVRREQAKGVSRKLPADVIATFAATLPFPLTGAQRRACEAIGEDLSSVSPMNRLLQGDVGSGKTWVAFFAAYAMWKSNSQSALMAPTEILAEQHFHEAVERLIPLGMKVALLTGSTPDSERRSIQGALERGELDLLVGTHALLTEDVLFRDLGLVITDEQHRFGVSQRSILRRKGNQPDVLFLSATPIPRTLALAVYGDLDTSVLNELPKGRSGIQTHWLKFNQEEKAIRLVRKEISKGRQAYVVAPLVEESEELTDVQSATQLYERLKEQFAGFGVALLHGRMSSREKEDIMRKFVAGETQVLISTTVIEVGINVPNATVMLIYHAERFGLAQLHQLRGRVGRGSERSYCILLSDASGDIAKERLNTMVETTDGFVIAEKDLQLRGPGEFLGVRQSGLPEFTVGDLSRDLKVMEVARDEALQLVSSQDFWLLPKYERLRDYIYDSRSRSRIKD